MYLIIDDYMCNQDNIKNELVSIIVPVYNTKKYLNKCIDSLLSQTYTNIEILLVDDGSTDGSSLICDQYSKEDNRIRVWHKKNEGVSIARNYALDRAKGDWITFCDSDDWLHRDTIAICSTLFDSFDFIRFLGVHVYNKEEIRKSSPIVNNKNLYLRLLLSRQTGMGVCGGIYRSELFNNVRFNPKLYMGEDWLVLVLLVLNCNRFKYLKEYFYYYNKTSETSCCNSIDYNKWINCYEAFAEIKKYLSFINDENYSIEFNTTKVAICFEAFKSVSLCKFSNKELRECYDMLQNRKIIPKNCEVIYSHSSFIIRFLILLWSNKYCFPYICLLYKKIKHYK